MTYTLLVDMKLPKPFSSPLKYFLFCLIHKITGSFKRSLRWISRVIGFFFYCKQVSDIISTKLQLSRQEGREQSYLTVWKFLAVCLWEAPTLIFNKKFCSPLIHPWVSLYLYPASGVTRRVTTIIFHWSKKFAVLHRMQRRVSQKALNFNNKKTVKEKLGITMNSYGKQPVVGERILLITCDFCLSQSSSVEKQHMVMKTLIKENI